MNTKQLIQDIRNGKYTEAQLRDIDSQLVAMQAGDIEVVDGVGYAQGRTPAYDSIRVGMPHESVKVLNTHTGQRIGPYKIDYARGYKDASKWGDNLMLLDLNGEHVQ